jgi:hypothetical protein
MIGQSGAVILVTRNDFFNQGGSRRNVSRSSRADYGCSWYRALRLERHPPKSADSDRRGFAYFDTAGHLHQNRHAAIQRMKYDDSTEVANGYVWEKLAFPGRSSSQDLMSRSIAYIS